ncbi:hypothetical protein [Nonomuraea insulae]|uniref:Uncharacterized protein n=1 Tax=Nonomuraea insulae TaxID=1616787 RepID=A0ABW1D1L1_9ACTN
MRISHSPSGVAVVAASAGAAPEPMADRTWSQSWPGSGGRQVRR